MEDKSNSAKQFQQKTEVNKKQKSTKASFDVAEAYI